jgi:hypothetical protein
MPSRQFQFSRLAKLISVPDGEVLHTSVTPRAHSLLHTLIKQDACAEDEMIKQRLQRRMQKFAMLPKQALPNVLCSETKFFS